MRRLYDGYILGRHGGLPLQKNRVYPNNCRIEPRKKHGAGNAYSSSTMIRPAPAWRLAATKNTNRRSPLDNNSSIFGINIFCVGLNLLSPQKISNNLCRDFCLRDCEGYVRIADYMVPVAQWQSASLWMKMLRVRPPPGTQDLRSKVYFLDHFYRKI